MKLKTRQDGELHIICCAKHPRYKAMRRPKCSCESCWFIWFNVQGREYFGW